MTYPTNGNALLEQGVNRNTSKQTSAASVTHGSPISSIISRLEKLKKNGQGRWLACCPAHSDKTASLSVRETETGSVLLHCFAGCSVHEVLSAIGLKDSDLFPPKRSNLPVKGKRHFDAYTALKALSADVVFLLVACRMVINREPLAESDMKALAAVTERVRAAKSFVLGA